MLHRALGDSEVPLTVCSEPPSVHPRTVHVRCQIGLAELARVRKIRALAFTRTAPRKRQSPATLAAVCTRADGIGQGRGGLQKESSRRGLKDMCKARWPTSAKKRATPTPVLRCLHKQPRISVREWMAAVVELGDAGPGASVSELKQAPDFSSKLGCCFWGSQGQETSEKQLSNLFYGQGHESYMDKNTVCRVGRPSTMSSYGSCVRLM